MLRGELVAWIKVIYKLLNNWCQRLIYWWAQGSLLCSLHLILTADDVYLIQLSIVMFYSIKSVYIFLKKIWKILQREANKITHNVNQHLETTHLSILVFSHSAFLLHLLHLSPNWRLSFRYDFVSCFWRVSIL